MFPACIFMLQGHVKAKLMVNADNLGYILEDKYVARAIEQGQPEDELRNMIRQTGVHGLTSDALSKVRNGVTSVEEAEALTWI